MRGIYTPVTDIRRKVFTEVARMSYEGGEYADYAKHMRDLPYKIIPGEVGQLRSSIFLERAIVCRAHPSRHRACPCARWMRAFPLRTIWSTA